MEKDKLSIIKNKIKNREEISMILSYWKFHDKKVVFTNGCFDIIHRGHIDYLSKTRDLGDVLIIGLNTDESVKHLKGENRPLQDEYSRALILASFSFVDLVVSFSEETPYNLIQLIVPDILVKGGDYNIKDIVGYDIVTSNGGIVKTIPFVDGFSTTNILKKGVYQ